MILIQVLVCSYNIPLELHHNLLRKVLGKVKCKLTNDVVWSLIIHKEAAANERLLAVHNQFSIHLLSGSFRQEYHPQFRDWETRFQWLFFSEVSLSMVSTIESCSQPCSTLNHVLKALKEKFQN